MIDYYNIHRSIEYYDSIGFQRVEVPWTVTKQISDITRPRDKADYQLKHNDKVLVASAEQSFLYQYVKGFLPSGSFQAVTPCFRDDMFDETHSKYFIKNELIITCDTSEDSLHNMIEHAVEFFKISLKESEIKIIKTGHLEYDIEYMGVELGSYGIRETSFLRWIYGTACAEPRLSYCQRLKKNELSP